MKKIIVPIDFSEYSEYALKTAAKLAKVNTSEIIVLHMLEMSEAILNATEAEQNSKALFFIKLIEQKLEKFIDKDYLKGIKVSAVIKHFKVFSEVNDVAKTHNADLVVMGSHGSSGLKEYFIGSNTERVVRYSDIPVLVVKNELRTVDFGVAVFACDFSEESIKSYSNASKMFNKTKTKMYLVYVNLPGANFKSSLEIEKKVVNFFNKAEGHLNKMEDVHYVSDYTPEKGVLTFANKIGADVIAIPTHGKKGLTHLLEGSVGEDVVNHSTLPVITFKI